MNRLFFFLLCLWSAVSSAHSENPISGFEDNATLVCIESRESACTSGPAYVGTGIVYCEHVNPGTCGFVNPNTGGSCDAATGVGLCNEACPEGHTYDAGTGMCLGGCSWPEVFNEITQQCETFDDCPNGEVPDPANEFQCIPNPCEAGQSRNATYGPYWANDVGQINADVPGVACIGSCLVDVTGSELVVSVPGGNCGFVNGAATCETPAGFNISIFGSTNGTDCTGDTPPPNCATCQPAPNGQPQDPPAETDNPTQEENEPSNTTTTQSTTDNGDGTSTTTRTTTFPDGSTSTTTTTSDNGTGNTITQTIGTTGGEAEETDGPDDERQYGGGECAAVPFCSGDAIDCAIARHLWEAKCALATDVQVDEAALEASLGDTDLSTIVDGGEVDASDPLGLGGYSELSAPSCPADYTFNVLGASVPVSWTYVCQLLMLIRPLVHAVGLFLATLIFYRGIVRE